MNEHSQVASLRLIIQQFHNRCRKSRPETAFIIVGPQSNSVELMTLCRDFERRAKRKSTFDGFQSCPMNLQSNLDGSLTLNIKNTVNGIMIVLAADGNLDTMQRISIPLSAEAPRKDFNLESLFSPCRFDEIIAGLRANVKAA